MIGKTAQLFGITARTSSLAQILSSTVKAEVFRLLFGPDAHALHLREVERRSGLALGTVRQELNQLVKLGLVETRVDGNRRYYQARKDHPLYPEIRGLVLKTSGLADLLRDALRKEKRIRVAFVFGSIAQAREQAHSDIDLLVIAESELPRHQRAVPFYAALVGLPVEVEVCKELGIHSKEEIEEYGVENFIQKCQQSVWRYMRQWERLTERIVPASRTLEAATAWPRSQGQNLLLPALIGYDSDRSDRMEESASAGR